MREYVKLNFFEKIYLHMHGKNDAKHGQFQPLVSENEIDNLKQEELVKISPFVRTELQRFECEKSAIKKKKRYFVELKKGASKKYFRYDKAIEELNSSILFLQKEQLFKQEQYENEKKYCEEKIRKHENALHLIRKEENLLNVKKKTYQDLLEKYKTEIQWLEIEKQRLCQLANTEIDFRWKYRMLRIRYYYEKASMHCADLNAVMLSETIFKECK